MSPPTSQAQAFWPFFPLLFVCIWITVSFCISRLGWRAFANRYAAKSRPPGKVYAASALWFDNTLASYRNVACVVLTPDGIYFNLMFLFRAFHPPFLIPWAGVKSIEKKDGFIHHGYQLNIENDAGEFHVILPSKVENDLFKYYKTN